MSSPLSVAAAAIPESDHQNGSMEVPLDDNNSGLLVDGFQRTFDGKLKCSYCSYASKGTARLIEHIRIHTGKMDHPIWHLPNMPDGQSAPALSI